MGKMRKKKTEWKSPKLTTDLLERIVKEWTDPDVMVANMYRDMLEAIIREALPDRDLFDAGVLLNGWVHQRLKELALERECEESEQEEWEPPRLTMELLERIVKEQTDLHEGARMYRNMLEAIVCEAMPDRSRCDGCVMLDCWMNQRLKELSLECEESKKKDCDEAVEAE